MHIENLYSKIVYSFIQTYFLTNGNPYGRSLLFPRHTFTFLNLTHAKRLQIDIDLLAHNYISVLVGG